MGWGAIALRRRCLELLVNYALQCAEQHPRSHGITVATARSKHCCCSLGLLASSNCANSKICSVARVNETTRPTPKFRHESQTPAVQRHDKGDVMPVIAKSVNQFRHHVGFSRNNVQGACGPGPRQWHRGQGRHEGKQGLPCGGDIHIAFVTCVLLYA